MSRFLAHIDSHEHHSHDLGSTADWGNHATGEFCGAVFFLLLNQRFHRLFPENETFVGEIETRVFNEGPAHQGANGTGIRYFSNLNNVKENPGAIGTCCEGQGTRLYGSLNSYIYSLPSPSSGLPDGVFVDLYAPSSIAFVTTKGGVPVNVTTSTAWPYGTSVSVTVTAPSSSSPVPLDLALRIPAWVSAPSVPVSVNGQPAAATGTPGTYLHVPVAASSSSPATVAFSLDMGFTPHFYTGDTQIPGFRRYAYSYGPILLAALGPWNSAINALSVNMTAAGLDPSAPGEWMAPAPDGNPLHFVVKGVPGVSFVPYGEINTEQFSVYPAFD
jgi:DUF1680 family protein